MKIAKSVLKIFKKALKLFIKGGKIYYKAKLKHLVTAEGITAQPVDPVIHVSQQLEALVSSICRFHGVEESSVDKAEADFIEAAEEAGEGSVKIIDKNNLTWEYDVEKTED